MPTPPRRNVQGFALLEAVTAIFVAAVGLFGSLQMFQYCVHEIRTINEYEIAARIVQNEIETLRAEPFEAIEIGARRPFISTSPELAALPGARAFTESKTDPALPSRLKEVTAVVCWRTMHGGLAERRLSTLVARRDRP